MNEDLQQAEAFDLVDRVRDGVNGMLVGQSEAKLALLIAVLAGEHLLLEGPPGSGKSLLAERGLALVGGDDEKHVCAFHRDTRREDLLGSVNLLRERLDSGERLSFELRPGGLVQARLVVLEDLDRAPGEALAPLLQLLGSRRMDLGRGHSVALPLETAVATMAGSDQAMVREGGTGWSAIDPLEPSQLDRFALQVSMPGLVTGRSWGAARSLLDLAVERRSERENSGETQLLTRHQRLALKRWVGTVPYPVDVQTRVKAALASLARRVREAGGPASGRGLLSDRVFGAVLPKLLRAHAVVQGRDTVAVQDLHVLRLVVAQRLPEGLLDVVEDVIQEAISVPPPSAEQSGDDGESVPLTADENNDQVATDSMPGQVPAAPSAEADLPEAPPLPPRRRKPRPADVEPLIRAFEGQLDRGRSDLDDDPGGQPRGYRPLRRFDELVDADPLDALLLVDGVLAGPPRVQRRRRRTLGGAVVVARDVSSSMAGFRNDWASELICGVVRAAARRKMRVGYLEFHQRAMPRMVGGRLLHRRYDQLNNLVREARPMGQTNYEAPLRMALDALKGRRGRNRHVVMLTDGLPILGDTQVRAERALATKLGVSLHTVFIGDGDSPPVLDAISHETAGLRFQAIEEPGGLVLKERLVSVA